MYIYYIYIEINQFSYSLSDMTVAFFSAIAAGRWYTDFPLLNWKYGVLPQQLYKLIPKIQQQYLIMQLNLTSKYVLVINSNGYL